MTPRTGGPGLIDVAVVILSPLILVILTAIFFLGAVARRVWER